MTAAPEFAHAGGGLLRLAAVRGDLEFVCDDASTGFLMRETAGDLKWLTLIMNSSLEARAAWALLRGRCVQMGAKVYMTVDPRFSLRYCG